MVKAIILSIFVLCNYEIEFAAAATPPAPVENTQTKETTIKAEINTNELANAIKAANQEQNTKIESALNKLIENSKKNWVDALAPFLTALLVAIPTIYVAHLNNKTENKKLLNAERMRWLAEFRELFSKYLATSDHFIDVIQKLNSEIDALFIATNLGDVDASTQNAANDSIAQIPKIKSQRLEYYNKIKIVLVGSTGNQPLLVTILDKIEETLNSVHINIQNLQLLKYKYYEYMHFNNIHLDELIIAQKNLDLLKKVYKNPALLSNILTEVEVRGCINKVLHPPVEYHEISDVTLFPDAIEAIEENIKNLKKHIKKTNKSLAQTRSMRDATVSKITTSIKSFEDEKKYSFKTAKSVAKETWDLIDPRKTNLFEKLLKFLGGIFKTNQNRANQTQQILNTSAETDQAADINNMSEDNEAGKITPEVKKQNNAPDGKDITKD